MIPELFRDAYVSHHKFISHGMYAGSSQCGWVALSWKIFSHPNLLKPSNPIYYIKPKHIWHFHFAHGGLPFCSCFSQPNKKPLGSFLTIQDTTLSAECFVNKLMSRIIPNPTLCSFHHYSTFLVSILKHVLQISVCILETASSSFGV